jgi:hypothetical protein
MNTSEIVELCTEELVEETSREAFEAFTERVQPIINKIEKSFERAQAEIDKAVALCEAHNLSMYFPVSPLTNGYESENARSSLVDDIKKRLGEKIGQEISDEVAEDLDLEELVSQYLGENDFYHGDGDGGWQHSSVC